MPTYLIEREIPGAEPASPTTSCAGSRRSPTTPSRASSGRTRGATATWPATRSTASTRPRAPRSSSSTRRRGGFPADLVAEVSAVFDSTGPREPPGLTRADAAPRRRPRARAVSPASRSAVTGRHGRERAQLRAALAAARGGPRLARCCVSGEAGVGKTRLVEEALGDGRRCVRGVAVPPAARRSARSSPPCAASCAREPGRPRRLRPAAAAPRAAAPRARRGAARRRTARRCSRRSAAACATMVAERPGGDAARRRPAVRRGDARAARRARARPARAAAARSSPPTAPTSSRAPPAAAPAPRPAPRPRARRADRRAARRRGHRRGWSSRCSARRPSPRLAAAAARAHRRRPVLRRGADRGAGRRRAPRARARTARSSRSTPTSPLPQTIRDAVLVRTRLAVRRGARAPPRPRPRSAPSFDLELVAEAGGEDGLAELLAAGLIARDAAAAAPPSATRSRARRSTTTSRGCAAARCTAGSPRRCARAAPTPPRWRRTGSARATRRARSRRCSTAAAAAAAVHAYRDAARLGRQALDLWPEGERARRPAGSRRALRRPRRAGRRPRRGGPRAARGRRRAPRRRRGPRAGRRRAAHRRASTRCRATASARWPRGASPPRRTRRTACPARPRPSGSSCAGYLQSAGRHAEAAETARLAGEEAVRAERTDLRARAMGLQGVAARQGRRLRRRHRDHPRRPVPRARARAHRRGGGGLPAARHRPRDPRATTAAPARRSARRSASARPPDAGALRAGLPQLHGLRAARARRLGPGRSSSATS